MTTTLTMMMMKLGWLLDQQATGSQGGTAVSVESRLRHALDCQTGIEQGRFLNVAEYARRYRLSDSTQRRWIANIDTMTDQCEEHANQ